MIGAAMRPEYTVCVAERGRIHPVIVAVSQAWGCLGHRVLGFGKQEVSVVDFSDRTLVCRDCGKPFTWTAGEQTFYAERACQRTGALPECRAARKARLGLEPPRMMHTIVCAECGQETTVPFVPRNGRPVLCSSCFARSKVTEELVVPMAEVAVAD
jgi:CxxC-x17-CxxC domain-containing protein